VHLNTFSISARCPRTGMLGVTVSTAVPAVGGICPYIRPGVGAISTQSWVNPYLAIDGLELLERGLSAEDALNQLIEGDPGRAERQFGIVDASGTAAAWTGEDCVPWAGHRTAENVACQGNMLTGPETIEAMFEAFQKAEALELPERLLVTLEAGQAAGGDKRGKQSAAVKVYHREIYPLVDLRVDEHRHPVAELRRVFEVARHQYRPFIDGLPKRDDPEGGLTEAVVSMLMTPPPFRPGGGGNS